MASGDQRERFESLSAKTVPRAGMASAVGTPVANAFFAPGKVKPESRLVPIFWLVV